MRRDPNCESRYLTHRPTVSIFSLRAGVLHRSIDQKYTLARSVKRSSAGGPTPRIAVGRPLRRFDFQAEFCSSLRRFILVHQRLINYASGSLIKTSHEPL